MKQITFLIFTTILALTASANKGHNPAKKASLGNFEVRFHGNTSADVKDSVLVIFDRFDHTGAGVVYQVFYPNADGSVTIPAIPEGKYYITVQCLGLHNDRMDAVLNIKSGKVTTLKMNQQLAETFSKDNVVIPAYQPDPMNLGIVKNN